MLTTIELGSMKLIKQEALDIELNPEIIKKKIG